MPVSMPTLARESKTCRTVVTVTICTATREGVDLGNVRFGSKADSCSAATHVRFGPIADITHELFDHLVGEGEHVGWDGQS
jgi:hypothetical protein